MIELISLAADTYHSGYHFDVEDCVSKFETCDGDAVRLVDKLITGPVTFRTAPFTFAYKLATLTYGHRTNITSPPNFFRIIEVGIFTLQRCWHL